MLSSSELVIDGKRTPATSGATFDNVNPATEEVIGTAADAGPDDVVQAVAAARHAFDTSGWATDQSFRARCIRQLQEGLRRRAEELRAVLVAEAGVPVSVTQFIQLEPPIEDLTYLADLAESYAYEAAMPDRTTMMGPAHRLIRHEPVGVVAAITPWNYPMLIQLAKVVPTLAAGCTVVLKPAPDTPWSGALLGEIALDETDIPPGVFNVLTSADHGVGAAMTSHPDVDMVTFTGSTATGRKVMEAGATTIKRLFLELGGKSAAILLDDADLEAHMPFIAGQVCMHAGQGCALTTRLLVARSRYEEAIAAAEAVVATYPWGDPLDPGNMMGPVINASQFEKVLGYIDVGRSEGRLVTGGHRSHDHAKGSRHRRHHGGGGAFPWVGGAGPRDPSSQWNVQRRYGIHAPENVEQASGVTR